MENQLEVLEFYSVLMYSFDLFILICSFCIFIVVNQPECPCFQMGNYKSNKQIVKNTDGHKLLFLLVYFLSKEMFGASNPCSSDGRPLSGFIPISS